MNTATGNQTDELHFESRKEHRGWYFVDYQPPMPKHPLAGLNLMILDDTKATQDVVEAMEREFHHWIALYPVPVMVSAFDGTGSLLRVNSIRQSDHLLGRMDPASQTAIFSWDLGMGKDFPKQDMDPETLTRIFSDIPYRTGEEIAAAADERLKEQRQAIRWGWFLLMMWLVVIPAVIAIAGFGSRIIGGILLVYSLSKALVQWLKLSGRWPKSKWALERDDEERQMRHHHYYCKRNPEGFQRLKWETFEREERERTLKEVAALKKGEQGPDDNQFSNQQSTN